MPTTTSKTKVLGDRHVQLTVSPRLAVISKSLKTKAANRLVAVYAGFDSQEQAQRFAAWVQVNWEKSSYDVAVREGKRTQSKFEVKIRRPTETNLQALVERARLHASSVPAGYPPAPAGQQWVKRVATHQEAIDALVTAQFHADSQESAPLAPRRMPTKVRGLSID